MTTVTKSPAATERKSAKVATPAKRVTKKDQLIRLLSRKSGANVVAISEALGWQVHTTRAALTGLRKAGFDLSKEQSAKGGPARYRITRSTGRTREGAARRGGRCRVGRIPSATRQSRIGRRPSGLLRRRTCRSRSCAGRWRMKPSAKPRADCRPQQPGRCGRSPKASLHPRSGPVSPDPAPIWCGSGTDAHTRSRSRRTAFGWTAGPGPHSLQSPGTSRVQPGPDRGSSV